MKYAEDFLMPENRCGFYVSEKRKKIWLILLELLSEMDRVCKKHNLRYFAANGTLLGAVRHKGFVPWDDDLDLVMPRDDYNKLIAVAEQEFSFPFFLQVPFKERDYYRNYIRLRNENSTAISLIDLKHRGSKGIFVDIFPLDGCNESNFLQRLRYLKCRFLDIQLTNYVYIDDLENHIPLRKTMYLITKLFFGKNGTKDLILHLENSRAKYNYGTSAYVQAITHKFQETVLKKEVYEESIEADFEFLKIPIPKGYDEILTSVYGNYTELPPKSERGKQHRIFFDPYRSYSEYEGKLVKEEITGGINEY